MRLPAGTRLGPYELIAPIGAGGMGEVYRARDTRLGRDVALKVISPRLAADVHYVARFEREARAVAALSHPGIVALHDIGREAVDGEEVLFAVNELLEGETLRARLGSGALPVRSVLDLGAQIARALGSAHEQGVIHRDLKPENVFLTRDGLVKLLDFGLARLEQAEPSHDSPTGTLTAAGTVLGTAPYMSPEQAWGEAADARSDIFTIGTILHEIVTVHRPFDRGTLPETLAAIIREDPPDLYPSGAPPGLAWVIQRCLEKQPGDRLQSARDVALALDAVEELQPPSPTAHAATPRGRWALAALAAPVIGAFAVGYLLAPANASLGGLERVELTPTGERAFSIH